MKKIALFFAVLLMASGAFAQIEAVDYKGNIFDSYSIWVCSYGAVQPPLSSSVKTFTYTSTCPIVGLMHCDPNIGIILDFSVEVDEGSGDVYVGSATAGLVPEPGRGKARIKAGDEFSPKGKVAFSDKKGGIMFGKLRGGLAVHTTCYVKITGIRKK